MSVLGAIGKLLTRNPFNTGTKVGITTKPTPKPAPLDLMGPVAARAAAPAPVAPAAPAPTPAPTAAAEASPSLIDLLNSITASAPTVPAVQVPSMPTVAPAPVAPKPNLDAYLAPFLQAEKSANDTFSASQPVITGAYDQLRQRLGEISTAGEADNTKRAGDAAAQQAALADQIKGLMGGVSGDLSKQGVIPSLAGGVAAVQGAQQANLAQQAGQQASLFKDMAARSAMDQQGRLEDASGGQAAALANSRNSLDAILQQIGVGKAGAERQYQQDSDNQARAAAAAQQAAVAANAKDQFQMELQSAQQQHSDAQTALKQAQAQKQAVAKSLVSPREQFAASMPERAGQYQKATAAFNSITKSAGDAAGGHNLATALTILNGYKSDPGKFAKDYGFVPDAGSFATLEQWLRAHYDDNKSVVDQDKLQQALAEISLT